MTTDYRSIHAVNWSSLKHLHHSALLYRHRLDHPEPPKPAYVIGNAAHTAILEPAKMAERYAIWSREVADEVAYREGIPESKAKGTPPHSGKIYDAWLRENPNVQSLKADEMDDVVGMAAAVASHKDASAALSGGRAEVVIEWDDPRTGIACKGRADYILPLGIIDLKTALSVLARVFGTQAAKLMYHGQLAFYHDGAITAGMISSSADPPVMVAVEKAPPYDVACREMTTVQLAAGRCLYRDLLATLQSCIEADYWPGVAPVREELYLPDWAPGMGGPEHADDVSDPDEW